MNIVIVGGGTAGWLAALFLKKIHGANRNIAVIESSKIGIIGAGEGSTGIMSDVIQNRMWKFDCNEDDFLKFTGSTPKLGIKHKHWKDTSSEYFGPIDASSTSGSIIDYIQLHAIANNLKVHTSTRNGILLENQKSTFQPDPRASRTVKPVATESHSILRYLNKSKGTNIITESLKNKNQQESDTGTILDENNIL